MGEDRNKFELPEDLFGSKNQDGQSPGKQQLDINFIKIYRRISEVSGRFHKRFERMTGLIFSVIIHLMLLGFLGCIVVSRRPELSNEISVDVITLDLKELKEMPQEPKPPEESDENSEETGEGNQEIAIDDIAINISSESCENNDILRETELFAETANVNLTQFSSSLSALKMPRFISSRSAGKRRKALKDFGGSDATENAVMKALYFLAAKQNKDGSWGSSDCKDGADIVLTSLASLTFLSHGERPDSKQYGKVIEKALKKLVEYSQRKELAKCGDGFPNAILCYALSEAVAVTDLAPLLDPMDKCVKHIVEGQNKFGSFYYNYDKKPMKAEKDASTGMIKKGINPGEPGCDLSFAGRNYQALTAASRAGSIAPGVNEAISKAKEALASVHKANDGGFSYGFNAMRYPSDPEMVPVGLLCLHLVGEGGHKDVKKCVKYLERFERSSMLRCSWKNNQRFPLYTWYYMTQALFHAERGKGKLWGIWNYTMKNALLNNQQPAGNWLSPASEKSDSFGENIQLFSNHDDLSIYCTSFCAIMLQVYYRYLPGFELMEEPKNIYSIVDEEGPEMKIEDAAPWLKKDLDNPEFKKTYATRLEHPVKFGAFNGKPSSPEDKLVGKEFKILSKDENTVQVRKVSDFPQQLKPGQRIAIYLDSFIPENFTGNILFTASVGTVIDNDNSSKLNILVNSNDIWKHIIKKPNILVSTVIPGCFMESAGNIIQIRNEGKTPISFDYLKLDNISSGSPVRIALGGGIDRMPQAFKDLFTEGLIIISSDTKSKADAVISELKKYDNNETAKKKLEILQDRFSQLIKLNPSYAKELTGLCQDLEKYPKPHIDQLSRSTQKPQLWRSWRLRLARIM